MSRSTQTIFQRLMEIRNYSKPLQSISTILDLIGFTFINHRLETNQAFIRKNSFTWITLNILVTSIHKDALYIHHVAFIAWHKLSTAIIIRADNREACLQPETRPGRFLKIIFQKGKIIDKLSLIASAGAPHLGSSPANILPFNIHGYRKHILKSFNVTTKQNEC